MVGHTSARSILYYCGGFQPIGGVEAFVADLILSMPPSLGNRWAAVWSRPVSSIPMLSAVRNTCDRFIRSPVRWGCRWQAPDHVLLRRALGLAAQADLLVFPKLMPLAIHRRLRQLRHRLDADRPIPAVVSLPYRPKELWAKGFEPELAECFDVMVVAAASFADDLREFGYRGRVEVIPLLPPPPFPAAAAPIIQGGPMRLAFLGRLEAQKNLPYLLQITELLAKRQAVQLCIYGDGSLRAELERSVSQSQAIKSVVQFRGAVDGDAKWAAFDSNDIFLNTSWTEGQCIVALEALGRGRPFAATGVGAIPDIIDSPELGTVLPLNDAPAAAALVEELMARWRDQRTTPQIVQERFQRRYGREAVIAQYSNLFSEMMSGLTAIAK